MQRLWSIVDQRPLGGQARGGVVFALTASAIAASASMAAQQLLHVNLPYAFGMIAVAACAAYAGFVSALIATAVMIPVAVVLGIESDFVTTANTLTVALFCLVVAVFGGQLTHLRVQALYQARRLAHREAYLQSIFTVLPAAMLVADGDDRIVAVNEYALELFGRQDEVIGMPLATLLQVRPGESTCARGLRTIVRPDGSRRQISTAWSALPFAAGEFRTVYVRDETKAVAAAEQLAEVQAELRQIARATAIGQLGTAIAHELNQPLASAANFIGVARAEQLRGGNAATGSQALEDGLQQIFRAAAVLKRLREFVRGAPLQPVWLGAREVLSEGAKLGALALKQADAALRIDLADDLGEVRGDAIQVQQVVLNLLLNAAEAVAGRHERVVTLRARVVASDRLVVSVQDSGPGVRADRAASLFTPFRTTKKTGLGVGLAICRTIIEAHGGTIACTNVGEKGAMFSFSLPRRCRDAADVAEERDAGHRARQEHVHAA